MKMMESMIRKQTIDGLWKFINSFDKDRTIGSITKKEIVKFVDKELNKISEML